MEFEYDADKSASNKIKHGIDFERVQELWADSRLLQTPALTEDEPRYIVTGRIDDKHWSTIFTYRNGAIRIISARRARKSEIEAYEKN